MILSFMLVISMYNGIAHASSDVRKVKVIEFKDLNYLSKYEIIDKVGVTVKGDEIIIDVDSLKRVLQEMPLVKSFNIVESEGQLLVVVQENKPVFLLALRKGNKLIPFELDEKFRIISIGRVHASNMPLVIVPEDDIEDEEPSAGLKNFLLLLKDLSEDNLSTLLGEIGEIDLTDMLKARIFLNCRKTAFIMRPTKENFYRLNYSVGYFDRIRYYPEVFEITNALGIIK